jgi:YD repeat-containing protein
LSKGTKVEIIDDFAGGSVSYPWYKIKYDGEDAYVAGWYVSQKEALYVTYPTGSKLIFNYNAAGDMATSNSSDDYIRIGQDEKYEYELVKKDQSIFRYDADGKVRAYTDRYGNPITFKYNSNDQLIKLTDAFKGRSIEISYNAEGLISSIKDAMGRSTKYTYDNQSRMTAFTDMEGQTTKYDYDNNGRMSKVTDANGHQVVRNNYDLLGRMVRQYDGQNNIKYFIYDDNIDEENSISARYIIDENGNESKITFGPGLRPITVRDALGGLTEYTYYYKESGASSWTDISTDVIVRNDVDNEYSDAFKVYQE